MAKLRPAARLATIRCTKCGWSDRVRRNDADRHITRHRERWCPVTGVRPPSGPNVVARPENPLLPELPKRRFCWSCREEIVGDACEYGCEVHAVR